MLTDGRTPDACIYYKLTYEPSAQVRWAKKLDTKILLQLGKKLKQRTLQTMYILINTVYIILDV